MELNPEYAEKLDKAAEPFDAEEDEIIDAEFTDLTEQVDDPN